MIKHLLCLSDWTGEEILETLSMAEKLKYENKNGIRHNHLLKGKTLGLIFSKASTRTRVSFEVGMYQLGGYSLFLSANDIQLGRGETVADTAKTLSRYIDGIMIRTYKQRMWKPLLNLVPFLLSTVLPIAITPVRYWPTFRLLKRRRESSRGLKWLI